jgi:predicted esterase
MTKTARTDQSIERAVAAQINLYYDLILPQSQPAPLLIALHGYGAGKWHASREAKLIVPEGFAIASLQGPHQHLREPKQPGGPLRFGFGWLTSFRPEESVAIHHRALLEIIESLAAEELSMRRESFCSGFPSRAL